MPEKLMAIILSLGLISGIGIAGIGSASAATKPGPILSTVQESTPAPTSRSLVRLIPLRKSIPFCRIVKMVIPLAAVVIIIKIPTNTIAVANAVASSLSSWVCS